MSDWRLRWQEDYLMNETLFKVSFPHFWEVAYKDKNTFYKSIEKYAKQHVETLNSGHDFLNGDKVQHLWHEHCEFCWEKATTDKECSFYCTGDLKYWVCEECFNDFKEQFHLKEKSEEDLLSLLKV